MSFAAGMDGISIERGPPADGGLDIRHFARALARHKWWIIVPTALAFGASMLAVNLITPRYTAETKILLENQNDFLRRADKDQRSNDPSIDQDAVQSQVQLLNSRDIARSVVRTLNLTGNPEFDPYLQGFGPVKQSLVALGLSRNPAQSSPEDRVLDNYFERLLAYSVRGSRVLVVEFSSRDPELAARTSSAIAAAYLAEQEKAKQVNSRSAGVWLNGAIEPLRRKLALKEAEIETYRSNAGLFVGANNTTIASQQLTELNTQLSNARAQQAELAAKAGILRDAIRNNKLFDISDVANNELVRNLARDRSTLRAQIAQEERTLLPGHPQMKALQAQVEALEQQIRSAGERTSRALENDSRTAGARVASLAGELDELKKQASISNEADIKLRALDREAKSMRDQLESFTLKYSEAVSRDAANASPADARVISSAVIPDTPSFPKKLPIVLVATMTMLLLSGAIIVTRELLSGRAGERNDPIEEEASFRDREGSFEESALARAPQPLDALRISAWPEADGAYALALEELLEQVRAVKPGDRGALISLVQPGLVGEARGAALDLARALVPLGRTILVDLDVASASLDALIAADEPGGILDVLNGRAGLGEAIHRDRATRLHLMPLGRDVQASAFVREQVRLGAIVDAVLKTYDFVVLEAGAAADATDIALSRADLVLLVAEGDEHDPRTIGAYEAVKDRGARAVSVVLTPARAHPARLAPERELELA